MSDTKTVTASLQTPEGAASYPSVFVAKMPPNPKPGDKARFQISVLFGPEAAMTPEDQAKMKKLKAAALQVAVDKFGQEKTGILFKEGKLGWPFKKDVQSKGYPAEFESYISAWSYQQPGIVERYAGPDGKALPVTNESLIYAGARVMISVRPFAYDSNGNKGVAFGLQNIQYRGKGTRIDGRTNAADEFEVEARPEAELGSLPDPVGNAAPPANLGSDLSALLG